MTRFGVAAGLFAVLGLCVVSACSAGDSKSSDLGSGAAGTGAGMGVGAGVSAGGEGAVGGFSGTGGMGQGGSEACQEIDVEATPLLDAADIIFVIDTSGSMFEEMAFVQQNMNAFSQQIVASGVDVRVVMLAEGPMCPFNICLGPGICIDPPLGAGGCPAAPDSNPPAGYFHPPSEISSTDALTQIVDLYPSYGGDLREGTHKYIVIVSDDNASAPNIDDAQTFINTFTALDPMKLAGTKVHGIYCFDSSGPCADTGTVYQDLVNLTGGIHGNLASQDFQPIFNDMAQQVIVDAGVPCQYPIPEPPDGEELDPTKVNVAFTDGMGGSHEILQVASFNDCDPNLGGWYYNDPNIPTVIHMCPATCNFVSTEEGGAMDIKFGCATKVLAPE
jgi:hypothetical protein